MLAQGSLSPLLSIEAKIQSRIAKFLSMKEVLTKLMKAPSATIRYEAIGLMEVQRRLENELSQVLKKIDQFKSGAWSFSDIAMLGAFYTAMEDHIKKVTELEKQSGLIATPIPTIYNYLPYILFASGLAIGYSYLRMRR